MKIADNIKTALIVDDKAEEVKGLEDVLDTEGIYHTFLTPEEIDNNKRILKNHQIIFMDFSLDDTQINQTNNIALIRKALKKICSTNFGSYGLVLWTKHMEHIQEFKEKLSIDAEKREYITPLFVVGLDKSSYCEKNDFSSIWYDLNVKLNEDKAASFFFTWRTSVETSADEALNNMYQLVPNYEDQSKQFQYLLYQMAKNYSGIHTAGFKVYDGMYKDAYKAFDELLFSDLISKQSSLNDVFSKEIEDPGYTFEEELKRISKINSKFLFDFSITDQNIVMPGNVYRVLKENIFLQLEGAPKKQKYNPIPIAIEMTPPCDFSYKKVSSRLIGGFMIDCPFTKEKLNNYVYDNFKANSKYLIWPITYVDRIRFLCFDFRNIYIENDENIKDTSSYELLFMVRHRLFADILQKFSSHVSRLGLSIVQPNIEIDECKQ